MLIGNKRELCWKIKSELAVKTLVIYMSLTKFSLLFPFPHTVVNVRICKGKGRFTMFFCLGGIVCIKLSENGSPVKLHHISDIPNFPLDSDIENYFFKYSICSVYIVKSLIFSLWIHLYNFPAKTYCYFSAADSSSLHWSFTANRFYRPCFYFFIFYWLSQFYFDIKMASNEKMWCD